MSGQARGAQTKQAVLEAAIELYAQGGARGTGLMAIAEQAGVTHATVLYHFGSSRDLLFAVLGERERRYQAYIGDAFDGPCLDALQNLPIIAKFRIEHPALAKLFWVLQMENIEAGADAHDYFVGRRRAIHAGLVHLLDAAKEEGDVRDDIDAPAKADEILSFTSGAQVQHTLDPKHVELMHLYENYTAALIGDLRRGTRRRRARAAR